MIYSVLHTTTFRYERTVRESVVEVRLQPRSDGEQRCLGFSLQVEPAAAVMGIGDDNRCGKSAGYFFETDRYIGLV